MPQTTTSPRAAKRGLCLIGRCAAVLVLTLALAACGDGYRGYFIWGNPPQPDDDEAGLVIVITKAQLNLAQETVTISTAKKAVSQTSAALQAELARLHTTDATGCEPGGTVYELELQKPHSTQRYRSHNWVCNAAASAQVKDYISSADLAYFAQLFFKEQ